ncbi:epoxide hydrolase N-terminal domain-containing protein [Streptomyces niveiscabiei]|uniref:epoxide hydrolase N-terminal domain-containing protein n=1 Tax=Streptomyces niveiscabiei TaxID=164115 RepID=UPI0038F689B5
MHEWRLNSFAQYTTEIDGQNVHFLHVRYRASVSPAPPPSRAGTSHGSRGRGPG